MPTAEWMKQYEAVRHILDSNVGLDSYFTEERIGTQKVDVLEIGELQIPTGQLIACDPFVSLGDAEPYLQTIPTGSYPVRLCVVPSEKYGDRYACAKLAVSEQKPVRYELAVTGQERLEGELEEGSYFGFGVDADMACVADLAAQTACSAYVKAAEQKDEDFDLYSDVLEEQLQKNVLAHPKYQREGGDWLNWTVPGTEASVAIFTSGWGDGYYPVYFGFDSQEKVCGVYIQFIDIERTYTEEEEA